MRCFRYLQNVGRDRRQGASINPEFEDVFRLSGYICYEYATENWAIHARLAGHKTPIHLFKQTVADPYASKGIVSPQIVGEHPPCISRKRVTERRQALGVEAFPLPDNTQPMSSISIALHVAAFANVSPLIVALFSLEDLEYRRTLANEVDFAGTILLNHAARNGNLDLCQYLLNQGSKTEIPGGDERGTALHGVAASGRADILELLLDRGAELDARDEMGDTSLLVAVDKRQSNAVRFLLEKGSNIYALSENGRAIIELAHFRLGDAKEPVEEKILRMLSEHERSMRLSENEKQAAQVSPPRPRPGDIKKYNFSVNTTS